MTTAFKHCEYTRYCQ